MIVTVTPNPSLDRTILVDDVVLGAVHRARQVRLDPGGKGVNVSRALAAAEVATLALLPSGGPDGSRLAELLAPESVPVVEVPIGAATRSNIAVVAADGTTSKFNEPGAELTKTELRALEAKAAELAGRADWLVSCGSLPHGCPDDLHARLLHAARRSGARVAVDTSGRPLALACAANPELISPNLAELAELAGHPLPTLGEVLDVALRLRKAGVGAVLVSLGEQGALLVEDAGTWHAVSEATVVRSTVGAGDATLAGFLLAGAAGPEALRTAVAYGTAAVEQVGTRMPRPKDLRTATVRVTEADPSSSLNGAAL
ncbi:1-phosphofructokinase [Actinoalloteichus hymeniacidonis]|uniref:1-phosphofructokinase n=1 Tax=Actinoalloteichus hymeniacidonis TaxID=340345 RepID=A0AAC9N028_9PSEU|nr:1-phosphofructokinase [Actinoalloteichus hymeniacidonis]AOS64652.1 1-phosphofructokinase [Actinoalloteichus hymeniacidonis]MBB5907273.1 1-phosphofructokinase [Actinoalloteichus hymeniacidonis]